MSVQTPVSGEFLPGVLGVPGVIPALRDMKNMKEAQ